MDFMFGRKNVYAGEYLVMWQTVTVKCLLNDKDKCYQIPRRLKSPTPSSLADNCKTVFLPKQKLCSCIITNSIALDNPCCKQKTQTYIFFYS